MNIQSLPAPFNRRRTQTLAVRIEGEENPRTFSGRPAWLLERLLDAGSAGITTAELPPGVRASHYVMLLRRAGLNIETKHEGHSGPFAGRHGRYICKSRLQVVRQDEARAA